jgi:hypothetical protein
MGLYTERLINLARHLHTRFVTAPLALALLLRLGQLHRLHLTFNGIYRLFFRLF